MPEAVLPFIAMAALVVSSCFAAFILYRTSQYLDVRNSGLQRNDNRVVSDEFLKLLQAAKQEMVIYDDGDSIPDSIYDNEEIIEAIREKLSIRPDFRIRCLFNCDNANLKFRQAFASGVTGVEIKIRKDPGVRGTSAGDVPHYKMIDGGSQAHLSWHEAGSADRIYQIVDCSNVRGWGKASTIHRITGEYTDHFLCAFQAAPPVLP